LTGHASGRVHQLDIPSQDLASALKSFGSAAGEQLLFSEEVVRDKSSGPLKGKYTAEQALEILLKDSGLQVSRTPSGVLLIQMATQVEASTRAGSSRAPTPAMQIGSVVTEDDGPIGGVNERTVEGKEAAAKTLESIVVTGTRIRGGSTPSPVITIGSERIREEGFSDLGEVIRSVTQNFSGGQNPEIPGGNMLGGGLANQNVTGGSGLNLRGLGPDASLTLLNGRRMAYGGFWNAVDISAIPVDAVERIEIVADGASAIYGSDAVGGVGNVILKREFDGVALGARYGKATQGGLLTREYKATAGTRWDGGGLIAAYRYASVGPIYARQRGFTDYLPEPRSLMSESDQHNAVLGVHQQIGTIAELQLDVLRTEREQVTYFVVNTLSQYSDVTPATTTTLVSPSVGFSLPNDWMLTVGGAWGKDEHRQTQATVATPTGISTPLLDDCYCNEIRTYDAGAEGSIFSLRGGDARLAIGVGYRKNAFSQVSHLTRTIPIRGEESSRFGYAEIHMPFVDVAAKVAGVRRLELTAAMRREDYDLFGAVTTPKLGVIYGPSADFTLRASWGKSFKVPTLFQLGQGQFAMLMPAGYFGGAGYPDGATGLVVGGGNSALQPERARTWTASLSFHPEAVRGLEMELAWFNIDYKDRVVQPISTVDQALSNPIYAPFIDPYPSAQAQQAVIAKAIRFSNGTGVAYDPADVVALIHYEYANVARQEIQGVDISGTYGLDLGKGRMTLRGSATWLDSRQQASPAQAFYDLSGTLFNPAKMNSRAGVVWNQEGLTASALVNYRSSVINTLNGERPGSFTTVDATIRYVTGDRASVFSGLEFALSAQNLLDRKPPLYTPASRIYSTPYDPTNYSAIGRFLSVSVSKHF